MKKLLLTTVALAALSLPAQADIIANLGLNPTSGAGAFSNTDPGTVILPAVPVAQGGSNTASLGGAFIDIYAFTLDQAQTLTIAFATNTFAGGAPQTIVGFNGTVVYEGADNNPGGGDDVDVLGPEFGVACNMIPLCQVFGGTANLNAGDYHLRIAGIAGVDAGYGGNISTFAVPGPVAGAGLPALAGLLGLGLAWYRKRKVANQ